MNMEKLKILVDLFQSFGIYYNYVIKGLIYGPQHPAAPIVDENNKFMFELIYNGPYNVIMKKVFFYFYSAVTNFFSSCLSEFYSYRSYRENKLRYEMEISLKSEIERFIFDICAQHINLRWQIYYKMIMLEPGNRIGQYFTPNLEKLYPELTDISASFFQQTINETDAYFKKAEGFIQLAVQASQLNNSSLPEFTENITEPINLMPENITEPVNLMPENVTEPINLMPEIITECFLNFTSDLISMRKTIVSIREGSDNILSSLPFNSDIPKDLKMPSFNRFNDLMSKLLPEQRTRFINSMKELCQQYSPLFIHIDDEYTKLSNCVLRLPDSELKKKLISFLYQINIRTIKLGLEDISLRINLQQTNIKINVADEQFAKLCEESAKIFEVLEKFDSTKVLGKKDSILKIKK
jgi:hypothetical protein